MLSVLLLLLAQVAVAEEYLVKLSLARSLSVYYTVLLTPCLAAWTSLVARLPLHDFDFVDISIPHRLPHVGIHA